MTEEETTNYFEIVQQTKHFSVYRGNKRSEWFRHTWPTNKKRTREKNNRTRGSPGGSV